MDILSRQSRIPHMASLFFFFTPNLPGFFSHLANLTCYTVWKLLLLDWHQTYEKARWALVQLQRFWTHLPPAAPTLSAPSQCSSLCYLMELTSETHHCYLHSQKPTENHGPVTTERPRKTSVDLCSTPPPQKKTLKQKCEHSFRHVSLMDPTSVVVRNAFRSPK